MKWRVCFSSSLAVSLCSVVILSGATAKTIHVDDDAQGANDGTSWADAYVCLQDALTAAQSGDEIHVAHGVYKPDQGAAITPGDRQASFHLVSGVTIRGGYLPREYAEIRIMGMGTDQTVLSGDLAGNDAPVSDVRRMGSDPSRADNSYHVVTTDGVSGAVLDGFHLRGGHADGQADTHEARGGGAYLKNDSELTLMYCTFSCNYAGHGGGLSSQVTTLTLVHCPFYDNLADIGGGMAHGSSTVMLAECSFRRNVATDDGGAIRAHDSSVSLVNCRLHANASEDRGGAIGAQRSGLDLANCVLGDNTAPCSGGALNCGVCLHTGGPGGNHITLTNCTFGGNTADHGSAIQCSSHGYVGPDPSTILAVNCILWDAGDEIENNDGSTIDIRRSCVQGGYGGTGNIGDDPLFAFGGYADDGTSNHLSTGGDYSVLADSPCIDAGDAGALPPDMMDLDDDGDTAERVPWDIMSRRRIAEKPGRPFVVYIRPPDPPLDIGAYEYQDSKEVYRFWSPVRSRHFYTINEREKDKLITRYSHVWTCEEKRGYEAFPDGTNPDVLPVYRFWSAGNNSHFYTISEQEKNKLIDNYPHVWTFEGTAFWAHPEGLQPSLAKPVHRFWSPARKTHFYTIGESEKAKLSNEPRRSWQYEGVAWYAYEIIPSAYGPD